MSLCRGDEGPPSDVLQGLREQVVCLRGKSLLPGLLLQKTSGGQECLRSEFRMLLLAKVPISMPIPPR